MAPTRAPIIVVMGVSGSGKSSIGQGLAAALGLPFVEGDALHPPRNVALMAAGTPLSDDDRRGWLDAIAARLAAGGGPGGGVVASCSALKRSYRDRLRASAPSLGLVYLHGSPGLLLERMEAREGHYMPPSLLQSQLDILEPPQPDEGSLAVDVAEEPERIIAALLRHFEGPAMDTFTKLILFTDTDGRARFREEAIPLEEGQPMARLSALMGSTGYQLRMSPLGFRSQFHCTENPQWVFILGGAMEIGLQDGSSRSFAPGELFFSADLLPLGARFDPTRHGHWSRQVGDQPLVTLFVRG